MEYSLKLSKPIKQFRLRKSKFIRKIQLFKNKSKGLNIALLAGNSNHIYDFESGKHVRTLKTYPIVEDNDNRGFGSNMVLGDDFSIVTDFANKRRIAVN